MEKVYDYIVLGSGLEGSVAFLRLSEKSKRYDPGNFPKTNWNLRKYLWLPAGKMPWVKSRKRRI